MGSVSSINPGVADLLQTLSNLNVPGLSSPATITALENSSPKDLVQLSKAAIQLQSVDAMFGTSDSSSSGTDLSGALANLESLQPPSSTVLSTASPADQLANYQAALQASMTQGLFGSGTSSGHSGSSVNVIA
jgi:hypothetical protein